VTPQRTGASPATIVLVLAIGLAAGALVVISWMSGMFPWPPAPGFSAQARRPPVESKPDPLPVPSASEVSLARATGWYKNGRLHDALAALNAIRPRDPLRGRAGHPPAALPPKL